MIIHANRLEIIDHTTDGTGRDFVKWKDLTFKITIESQDDGRTVKLFLEDIEKVKVGKPKTLLQRILIPTNPRQLA